MHDNVRLHARKYDNVELNIVTTNHFDDATAAAPTAAAAAA